TPPRPCLYTLSLHDALPISASVAETKRQFDDEALTSQPPVNWPAWVRTFLVAEAAAHGGTAGWIDTAFYGPVTRYLARAKAPPRSEEHTSELQSRVDLVCRL